MDRMEAVKMVEEFSSLITNEQLRNALAVAKEFNDGNYSESEVRSLRSAAISARKVFEVYTEEDMDDNLSREDKIRFLLKRNVARMVEIVCNENLDFIDACLPAAYNYVKMNLPAIPNC